MDRKQKLITLASLTAASYLTGMTAVPALANNGNAGKVNINHKDRTITVSCNALDAHLEHADSVEESSIADGEVICAAKDKKQSEEKQKEQATKESRTKERALKGGTAAFDAETEANFVAALATLEAERNS